jgi:hypothetical protein
VVHKNNLVVRFIKRDGEMKWRKWWRERVGRRKGGKIGANQKKKETSWVGLARPGNLGMDSPIRLSRVGLAQSGRVEV